MAIDDDRDDDDDKVNDNYRERLPCYQLKALALMHDMDNHKDVNGHWLE